MLLTDKTYIHVPASLHSDNTEQDQTHSAYHPMSEREKEREREREKEKERERERERERGRLKLHYEHNSVQPSVHLGTHPPLPDTRGKSSSCCVSLGVVG